MSAEHRNRPVRSRDRRDRRDRRDDEAWLLARERGEPMPVISDELAARYARLEALLGGLPPAVDEAAPRPDWQDRVLAAVESARPVIRS